MEHSFSEAAWWVVPHNPLAKTLVVHARPLQIAIRAWSARTTCAPNLEHSHPMTLERSPSPTTRSHLHLMEPSALPVLLAVDALPQGPAMLDCAATMDFVRSVPKEPQAVPAKKTTHAAAV